MIRLIVLLLMAYAAVGLVLCFIAHVFSIAGIQIHGNGLFTLLGLAIFPLWLPVILIATKLTSGSINWGYDLRKGAWKILLSGCRPWLKYMTYGIFLYAFVNLAIAFIRGTATEHQFGTEATPDVWQFFSGLWMVFYSAGLAILVTAYRRGLSILSPKCPNGHGIGFKGTVCPTCGVRVTPHGNSAVQ